MLLINIIIRYKNNYNKSGFVIVKHWKLLMRMNVVEKQNIYVTKKFTN